MIICDLIQLIYGLIVFVGLITLLITCGKPVENLWKTCGKLVENFSQMLNLKLSTSYQQIINKVFNNLILFIISYLSIK